MKYIPVYLFIIILAYGCTGKSKNINIEKGNYALHITISDTTTQKAYLTTIIAEKLTIIDTAEIHNGNGIFKGNISHPEKATILFNQQTKHSFLFLLEPADFSITFTSNDFSTGNISHSPVNIDYAKFKKKSRSTAHKITSIYYDLQEARLQNNSNRLIKITSEIESLKKDLLAYGMHFLEKKPTSYASYFILKDLLETSLIDSTSFLKYSKKLSSKIQQHPNIKYIKKEAL